MNTRVHVVSFQVTPEQPDAQGVSGAYANAYVLATSEEEATAVARGELKAAGWSIEKVESTTTPDPSELSGDGLKYFEQCKIDGVVLVLHTWRNQH